MLKQVIADAGVIVALLDQREPMHAQVVQKLAKIVPPMLTCADGFLNQAGKRFSKQHFDAFTVPELPSIGNRLQRINSDR